MEAELQDVTLESYEGAKDAAGRLHGAGKAVFRSGAVYEGNWVLGKMHGAGKLGFPDGVTYEGSLINNAMSGSGAYEWPSGASYSGSVHAGRRHGQGKMSFADSPAVYEGDWVAGLRQGQGVLHLNANRTACYTGDWLQDQKHGHGVMQYPSGDVYDGHWQHDLKCGSGLMRWTALQQQYSGQWAANVPSGLGTHLWLQQATAPDAPPGGGATHALLLMFNRYIGHFLNGRRHGYGVLHYATGARYEGEWAADQKHGQGCFVFENGTVWAGGFIEDRPTIDAYGAPFAPPPSGAVALNVADLLEEEENAAASSRAVNNVLMCYNSELRTLYDKYCKRPSAHIPRSVPRPSFTLVAAQLWEMLADARLLTAHTPLNVVGNIVALARRPPPALHSFRQQMLAMLYDSKDTADVAFWSTLTSESAGAHCPFNELLFREFCEALLRLSSMRYQTLPGLERRMHTLINVHLLALVGKAKVGQGAPPRSPFQMEMISSDAVLALAELLPGMQRLYAHVVVHGVADSANAPAQDDEDEAHERIANNHPTTPRHVLQLLQQFGLLDGPLLSFTAAAGALCFHFLANNSFEQTQRLRIESDDSAADQQSKGDGGDGAGPMDPSETATTEEETEINCWLDATIVYPEVVEGLARCANIAHPELERLAQRLTAFWAGPEGLIACLDRP